MTKGMWCSNCAPNAFIHNLIKSSMHYGKHDCLSDHIFIDDTTRRWEMMVLFLCGWFQLVALHALERESIRGRRKHHIMKAPVQLQKLSFLNSSNSCACAFMATIFLSQETRDHTSVLTLMYDWFENRKESCPCKHGDAFHDHKEESCRGHNFHQLLTG